MHATLFPTGCLKVQLHQRNMDFSTSLNRNEVKCNSREAVIHKLKTVLHMQSRVL